MYEFEKKKLYALLGKDLVESLRAAKCYIAGGTITSLFCNREINDIDIYFRNKEALISFIEDLWECGSHWIVAHTKKATLIKNDGLEIQLIHFNYFKTPEEIFNTFDFTACMGCFDFDKEEFVLHNEFLKHNSQRILKFNAGTAFPIVSALRVQKYENKGYSISKPEFIRVLLSCMNLHITNYNDLKEQMGGMYGINYDKLFKDIDKENFSLSEVIEKLKDLVCDDDYFKQPDDCVQFDDVDDLIDSIMSDDIKCIELNGNLYRITSRNTLKEARGLTDYTEASGDEFFNKVRLYKYVRKVGDKYYSFHDPNFEYKLNEVVKPRPTNSTYGVSSLFCGFYNDRDYFTYAGDNGSVLIELLVTPENIKRIDGRSIELNGCIPLKEMPEDFFS